MHSCAFCLTHATDVSCEREGKVEMSNAIETEHLFELERDLSNNADGSALTLSWRHIHRIGVLVQRDVEGDEFLERRARRALIRALHSWRCRIGRRVLLVVQQSSREHEIEVTP